MHESIIVSLIFHSFFFSCYYLCLLFHTKMKQSQGITNLETSRINCNKTYLFKFNVFAVSIKGLESTICSTFLQSTDAVIMNTICYSDYFIFLLFQHLFIFIFSLFFPPCPKRTLFHIQVIFALSDILLKLPIRVDQIFLLLQMKYFIFQRLM